MKLLSQAVQERGSGGAGIRQRESGGDGRATIGTQMAQLTGGGALGTVGQDSNNRRSGH